MAPVSADVNLISQGASKIKLSYFIGIAEAKDSNPVEALIFRASSFQLLKLEN